MHYTMVLAGFALCSVSSSKPNDPSILNENKGQIDQDFKSVGHHQHLYKTVSRQRRSVWTEFFNSLAKAAETLHMKPLLQAEGANDVESFGKIVKSKFRVNPKSANAMLSEHKESEELVIDDNLERFVKDADSISLMHENANEFENVIINHIVSFVGITKFEGLNILRKNGINNKESEQIIKDILATDMDLKHLITHNISTIVRMRKSIEEKASDIVDIKDFFMHTDMKDVQKRLKEARKANLKWLDYKRDPDLMPTK